MSSEQRGNHIGEYRLGPRQRNTGDLGRLYRAHNMVTGAPTLVLRPPERQADDQPVADWTLRVRSSVEPAFIAIEVESAPADVDPLDAREELEFMLEDAHRMIKRAVEAPGTLGHLRSPPRRSPAPPRLQLLRRPAFAALAAAALAFLLLHLGSRAPSLAGASEQLAQADAGWGGAGSVAEDLVLSRTADELPIVLARAMPRKPFENQQRPPCDKAVETELFDGCWVETSKAAPCPDKLYEHEGKCYLPAAKSRKPSTAMRETASFLP